MAERPRPENRLCVGGPYDGRKIAVLNGSRFYAPLPRLGRGARLPMAAKMIAYAKQRIRTPDGDVSFFVPEGQSALGTMTMLLEAYERLSALKAKGLVDPVHMGEGSDG